MLAALCLPLVAVAGPATVFHLESPSRMGPARKLTVLLPENYSPRRRYPVLYLMDGQNLLEHPVHQGGWKGLDAVQQAVRQGGEPTIVVGVHAQDRINEYTPVPTDRHGGGGADKMLEHLVGDVIPFVESQFSVRRGRAGRAVGGSSLGALFAMHAVLQRPDVFKPGLIFSPSVWWANRHLLREVEASRTISGQRLVLYNGGYEDGRADAETLRDLLAHRDLRFGENLFHWTEPSAGHDESAWAKFFPRGLSLLFPARGH
jgi:predicted alpha/beta superfamily hydrolase